VVLNVGSTVAKKIFHPTLIPLIFSSYLLELGTMEYVPEMPN